MYTATLCDSLVRHICVSVCHCVAWTGVVLKPLRLSNHTSCTDSDTHSHISVGDWAVEGGSWVKHVTQCRSSATECRQLSVGLALYGAVGWISVQYARLWLDSEWLYWWGSEGCVESTAAVFVAQWTSQHRAPSASRWLRELILSCDSSLTSRAHNVAV